MEPSKHGEKAPDRRGAGRISRLDLSFDVSNLSIPTQRQEERYRCRTYATYIHSPVGSLRRATNLMHCHVSPHSINYPYRCTRVHTLPRMENCAAILCTLRVFSEPHSEKHVLEPCVAVAEGTVQEYCRV